MEVPIRGHCGKSCCLKRENTIARMSYSIDHYVSSRNSESENQRHERVIQLQRQKILIMSIIWDNTYQSGLPPSDTFRFRCFGEFSLFLYSSRVIVSNLLLIGVSVYEVVFFRCGQEFVELELKNEGWLC